MSREQTYTAFVLKRQDYNETDQIITLFTLEEGKLRCLVKASKLPTSKLQPALQPLFKVAVTVAGNSGLPKVIRAQILQTFPNLLDEHKLNCWYLMSELLSKALADGSPSEQLFHLAESYLQFLHDHELSTEQINLVVAQFQVKALQYLGMAMVNPGSADKMWFSNHQGGFVNNGSGADAFAVSQQDFALFQTLVRNNFEVVLNHQTDSKPLSQLINRFMTYQLERELKTAQFMNQ